MSSLIPNVFEVDPDDPRTTMLHVTHRNGSRVTFLIDTACAQLIRGHQWCTSRTSGTQRCYAMSGHRRYGTYVKLHRLIMHAPDGHEIDHVSGDTLDNRRANLRVATRSQNVANQKRRKDNASGFKGVRWQGNRCEARIRVNGQLMHLGYFCGPKEAHAAYVAAARQAFGEFARAE